MSTDLKETEIVTDPVRLAFPALFEPQPVSQATDAPVKYQAALLFPPDYDTAPLIAAMKAAMNEKWGKLIKLDPSKNPLKSCNDKDQDKPLAGYDEDWMYLNAKSDYQPSVVDQRLNPVIDPEKVYAGCWCRFHLQAYAWDNKFGKGVGFSLNSVQFVKNDDRLGGRKDPRDVFGTVAVDAFESETSDVSGTDDIFG